MTRVCLYTRISTDEENQPTSLHTQRERLEAFCAAQDEWRIVAHHEDRSTGAKLDRPGLQAALALAREGRVDLLLVYRVDRLSRKVRQLAQLAEELDGLGVVLRSATEPFDTGSAAGRMMLQMLAVFAEFEHATIVDRVTAGIERRAKEGRWATGRLPFGYRRNQQKLVEPDERTAPTVQRIFDLYTRGQLGTAAIAHRLADEQAPAPAAGWQPAVVQWVLENEAYLGCVGTLLALGDEDGFVELWAVDFDGPTLIAEFGERREPGPGGMWTSSPDPPFDFSRDNRRLAHGGVYGTAVRVWDLERQELTHELFGLMSVPNELVFGPSGEILAAAGFEGVCAWDLSVAQEPSERPWFLSGTLECAAVSPSGRMALLSYESGTTAVRIDSGPTREDERHPHHSAWPSEVCLVLPEQQLIAAAFGPGDGLLAGVDSGGLLYVWDLDDGEELGRFENLALDSKYRYDGEAAVAFGPDGSLLACVVDDVLYACDWQNENVVATGWDCGITDMRWTADGRFVALGGGGDPRALDVEKDELLTGEDAVQVVAGAYGGTAVVARFREFASLDPHERLGVRRFGSIRGSREDIVRISELDGSADVSWPAESPLYDARFVEPGERVVAVTVAGAIAVLEPVVPADLE